MNELPSYPRRVKCKKRFEIEIRPLVKEEIPAIRKFFSELSKPEQALLRRDIFDPFFDNQVKRTLEDELVYHLCAWNKDIIVGSVSLFRGFAQRVRHTCEMRILTHPNYRRHGIGSVMFEEVVPFARSKEIEKIYANLTPTQKPAIKMVKHIGFTREATLKQHIKDAFGRYHDIRLYSMDLEAAHRAMEEMVSGFADYSG